MRLGVFILACVIAAPPLALADERDQAAAHFEEAKRYYDVGQYEKALSEFKEAYLLSREPGLLLNIGNCYRYLGRYEEAKRSFLRFLQEEPGSEMRPEVERLIAEVEERLAKGKPAPVTTNPEPLDPTAPRSTLTISVAPNWPGYFELEVEASGKTFACAGFVSGSEPCSLPGVAGPARVMLQPFTNAGKMKKPASLNTYIPTGSTEMVVSSRRDVLVAKLVPIGVVGAASGSAFTTLGLAVENAPDAFLFIGPSILAATAVGSFLIVRLHRPFRLDITPR